MIGNTFKVIILIVVIGLLALVVGPCVYFNFIEPSISQTDMPDIKKATHSFSIENTGGLILSSKFEQHGTIEGDRVFELHGFWEMKGDKFKFIDGDIKLDERIFGVITVEKR